MTRDDFVQFVRAARMAVVATVDPAGRPEAALVSLAVCEDGSLVFNTRTSARKVANIAQSGRAALVIGWSGGVSVQVEGSAAVLAGSERASYGLAYEHQFPGSLALSADFSIVRVIPRWLRHYDARPDAFTVVEGPAW